MFESGARRQDDRCTVEADLERAWTRRLDASADLRALIRSPLYSRDAQGKAIDAIAAKMGLGEIWSGTRCG